MRCKKKGKPIMSKALKLTNQLLIATIIIAIHAMLLTSCNTSHRTASTPQSQNSQKMYSDYFDQADNYFEKKRWRKAEKTYKKAAECKETFAVNYNVGVSAYNRGRYNEAIKYFNKSLRYNHSQEDNKDTHNMIEKCNKQLKRRQEIIAASVGAALIGTSAAIMGASGAVGVPNNDPQYQAWMNYRNSGLPGASTISFEDFKRANARAAANGYQIGNSSSATSSSNNSSSVTKTKTCPLCHGSGKCDTCNGTHRFLNGLTGKYVECPNCKPDGKCSYCNGTGKVATH